MGSSATSVYLFKCFQKENGSFSSKKLKTALNFLQRMGRDAISPFCFSSSTPLKNR